MAARQLKVYLAQFNRQAVENDEISGALASAVGQGSAMLDVPNIKLEPFSARERNAIERAIAHLGKLSGGSADFTDEDVKILREITSVLNNLKLDDPSVFGVFSALIKSREDYVIGFTYQGRTGLAREAIHALEDQPSLLAEFLFHEIYASLHPESDKTDHRRRYESLQRRLFGDQNALKSVFRQIIDDLSGGSDEDLGQRIGPLPKPARDLQDELYRSFRDVNIGERHAETLSKSLVRLQSGSLDRLVSWHVLTTQERDTLEARNLSEDSRIQIAHRFQQVITEYQSHDFTESQINNILNRAPPYPVLLQIQHDTGVSRSALGEILERHADFDLWVYRAHSIVTMIADHVGGVANAWEIVIRQGIERSQTWVHEAKERVDLIKDVLNGPSNAWDLAIEVGKEDAVPMAIQIAVGRAIDDLGGIYALKRAGHLSWDLIQQARRDPTSISPETQKRLLTVLQNLPRKKTPTQADIAKSIQEAIRQYRTAHRLEKRTGVSKHTLAISRENILPSTRQRLVPALREALRRQTPRDLILRFREILSSMEHLSLREIQRRTKLHHRVIETARAWNPEATLPRYSDSTLRQIRRFVGSASRKPQKDDSSADEQIVGSHVKESEIKQIERLIPFEGHEVIGLDTSGAVEAVETACSLFLKERGERLRATLVQLDVPENEIDGVFEMLKHPTRDFHYFKAKFNEMDEEWYYLGNRNALAIDVVKFLRDYQRTATNQDLLQEYIIHEVLHNITQFRRKLGHWSIIKLTQGLFDRPSYDPREGKRTPTPLGVAFRKLIESHLRPFSQADLNFIRKVLDELSGPMDEPGGRADLSYLPAHISKDVDPDSLLERAGKLIERKPELALALDHLIAAFAPQEDEPLRTRDKIRAEYPQLLKRPEVWLAAVRQRELHYMGSPFWEMLAPGSRVLENFFSDEVRRQQQNRQDNPNDLGSMALAGRYGANDLRRIGIRAGESDIENLTDSRLDDILAGIPRGERLQLNNAARRQGVTFTVVEDPAGSYIKRMGSEILLNRARRTLAPQHKVTALIHDIIGHDWETVAQMWGMPADAVPMDVYEVYALCVGELRNIPNLNDRVRHALRVLQSLKRQDRCPSRPNDVLKWPHNQSDSQHVERVVIMLVKSYQAHLQVQGLEEPALLDNRSQWERTAGGIRRIRHGEYHVLDIHNGIISIGTHLGFIRKLAARIEAKKSILRKIDSVIAEQKRMYRYINAGLNTYKKYGLAPSKVNPYIHIFARILEKAETLQNMIDHLKNDIHSLRTDAQRQEMLNSSYDLLAQLAHHAVEILHSNLDQAAAIPGYRSHLLEGIVAAALSATPSVEYQSRIPQGTSVIGDHVSLEDGIRNLAENAVGFATQYAEETGRIPRVRVRTTPSSNSARLAVTDNGPGISSRYLRVNKQTGRQRILDIDVTTRRGNGGTGLGTNLAANAAQDAGGMLKVLSQQGRGSTFIMHLPAIFKSLSAQIPKNRLIRQRLGKAA